MQKYALLMSAATVAFMSEHPETVRIKRGGEVFTINSDDYDAKRDGKTVSDDDDHAEQPNTSFAPAPGLVIPPAPAAPNPAEAMPPQTVNEDTYTLVKKGKKFIVVYAKDATPVLGFKDIDEAGYATDAEAWAAIEDVKKDPYHQTALPPVPAPLNADAIQAAHDAAE